jgi:SH3-like domain-containing protein
MSARRIPGAAVAAALAAMVPAAVSAQAERRCEMNAYIADEDPKGVDVRGGPSNQSRIVHVIKPGDTMVRIAAERNGWFRIREVSPIEGKDRKLTGWLPGSRLAAGLMVMQGGKADERLLEEPSDRSKTLLLLRWDPGQDQSKQELSAELPWGKREVIDYKRIKGAADAKLLACENGYAKVRVHKYEGWLKTNRLCGSPVKTCN